MVLYCPICRYVPLEPLAIGNTFVYRCPNCGMYFQQWYGKLSPPMVKPPKEYLEKIMPKQEEKITLKGTHSIYEWNKFLSEYGLSQREYRRLPEKTKEQIRGIYRKYLKKRYVEKKTSRGEKDEYIMSGALKGLKNSEIPLFEKWLNDKLGVGLGEFYDQNPKIQRDLRTSFRQWLREQRITT